MWLTWEGFGGRFRLMFAVLVALERVLERLGLVLGRLGPSWTGACWADFWSILPHLRSVLGGLGEVLGGSWAVLERLGGVLERLGGAMGQIFLARGS